MFEKIHDFLFMAFVFIPLALHVIVLLLIQIAVFFINPWFTIVVYGFIIFVSLGAFLITKFSKD
jgi:hypothetical protein